MQNKKNFIHYCNQNGQFESSFFLTKPSHRITDLRRRTLHIYKHLLYFALFYFALFCFILFCFILFYFILFCFVLFYFILFYFVLFYFVLFYFILFCFVLFYFILFCFVLFCFILFLFYFIKKEPLIIRKCLWICRVLKLKCVILCEGFVKKNRTFKLAILVAIMDGYEYTSPYYVFSQRSVPRWTVLCVLKLKYHFIVCSK